MKVQYFGWIIVALITTTLACNAFTREYQYQVVTTTPVGAILQKPQGKLGDKITLRDLSITVTDVEEASKYVYSTHEILSSLGISKEDVDMPSEYIHFTPQAGNKFIAVEIIVMSETDRGTDLVGVSARLQNADGKVYFPIFGGKIPAFKPIGNAKKNTQTQGWVTFEVPIEAHGFSLIYEPAFSDQRAVIDLGK